MSDRTSAIIFILVIVGIFLLGHSEEQHREKMQNERMSEWYSIQEEILKMAKENEMVLQELDVSGEFGYYCCDDFEEVLEDFSDYLFYYGEPVYYETND